MLLKRTTLLTVGLSAALALSACGLGVEASGAQQDINAMGPAQDTQAQNNLQLAVTSARTAYGDSMSFQGVNAYALAQVEPSLQYTPGASTGPGIVSVMPVDANHWAAAVLSESGTCFYAMVDGSGSAHNGSAKSECAAADASRHVQ